MKQVPFNIGEESKVANSGGLALQKCAGKATEIALTSQWSKDGKDRTKNGALGVNTTLGWLNGSLLITFLFKLDKQDPVRQMLLAMTSPTEGSLNIDSTKVFYITADADGNKITSVSMGAPVQTVQTAPAAQVF